MPEKKWNPVAAMVAFRRPERQPTRLPSWKDCALINDGLCKFEAQSEFSRFPRASNCDLCFQRFNCSAQVSQYGALAVDAMPTLHDLNDPADGLA